MSSGILDIFKELRADNSATYKLNTLKKYKDNEQLKEVLLATYTPFKQYYIKQIPEFVSGMNETGTFITLDQAMQFLEKLSKRELTGNAAREQLSYTIDHMEQDDAEVLRLILDRSVDCGISHKTVNKVWKGLIGEIPYMRCEKLTDKTKKGIKYPALVQLKADGTFVNVIKHNKVVSCMTRNGTEFHVGKITEYFERVLSDIDNFVITGEVVLYKDGKVLDRKTGNGRITSYVKRETTRASILEKQKKLVDNGKLESAAFKKLSKDLTDKELEWIETEDMLVLEGWDLIEYSDWAAGKSDTPYTERFDKFKEISKDCPFLDIIPTQTINNFEEAQSFANQMMSEGLEGGVLKNINGHWENKTSKNQIKLKAERDADLLCIGYTPGTGDNEGGIGSLVCVTDDRLLEVSIGTGLSRDDRGLQRVDENDMSQGLKLRDDIISIDKFFDDTYKDKIIQAVYNEVINSNGKDTHSLFLPVYQGVRFDKDTADTLPRLLEGQK